MNLWNETLLNLLVNPSLCPKVVFSHLEHAAFDLGFEHLAYGFQYPYPITRPEISTYNNYPVAWQEQYVQSGYLLSDPTVAHGRRSQTPVLWSDTTFKSNIKLWQEAQEHRLRVGWAQSCLDNNGSGSMLTLCRTHETITEKELESKEFKMRWLVQVAHVSLSRAINSKNTHETGPLTSREREVLMWTADGKSAQDIADILVLSKSAVDFHLTNCIKKLQSSNKTAAVARAILLGLLR